MPEQTEPKADTWLVADRVSDQIVDIINAECKKKDFSPVQLLAGQCLALLSFMSTAPIYGRLASFTGLQGAIRAVLDEMIDEMDGRCNPVPGPDQ